LRFTRPRPALLSGALFLLSFLGYMAPGPTWLDSDPLPSRYLPISILREGDFDLDEFSFLYDDAAKRRFPVTSDVPYFLQREQGRVLSRFSPLPAVLAVPFYALPVWGGLDPRAEAVRLLEKVSAAAIVAASVAALFLALVELVSTGWAAAIAVVYAFGTSSFSLTSQALWEHGAGQLFVALTLYLLIKARADERLVALSGLTLTLAVVARIANVALALPIAVYVALTHSRRLPGFVLMAGAALTPLLVYQHVYFGSIFRHGHEGYSAPFVWRTPLGEGLQGLLLSPGRGLFVYSPVLALVIPGMVLAWTRGPRLLRYLAVSSVLFTLLYAKFIYWWAGWVYGPRYFADLSPILCVLLCPVAQALPSRRAFRAAFAALAVLSVAIHAVGAFCWDARWDAEAHLEEGLDAIWSWPRCPIVYYAAQIPSRLRTRWTDRRIRQAGLPTSLEALDALSATYEYDVPERFEAVAGGTIDLSVTAVNRGRAAWLSETPDMKGAVRLGWRWRKEGQLAATWLERLDMHHPVLPGESYSFRARLPVPGAPGDYDLEVGLVDELITWFVDLGQSPSLHFRVRVIAPVSGEGAPAARERRPG
jgi:hypothetical protein